MVVGRLNRPPAGDGGGLTQLGSCMCQTIPVCQPDSMSNRRLKWRSLHSFIHSFKGQPSCSENSSNSCFPLKKSPKNQPIHQKTHHLRLVTALGHKADGKTPQLFSVLQFSQAPRVLVEFHCWKSRPTSLIVDSSLTILQCGNKTWLWWLKTRVHEYGNQFFIPNKGFSKRTSEYAYWRR